MLCTTSATPITGRHQTSPVNQRKVLLVSDVILPEVSYLFLRDVGYSGVRQFLAKFVAFNPRLEALQLADIGRVHEIIVAYASAEFDVVDCCIMAQAERLNIMRIATCDRRDFGIFRPRHCDYLTLLP